MNLNRNILMLFVCTSLLFLTAQVHAVEEETQGNDRTNQRDIDTTSPDSNVRSIDEWSYAPIYEQGGFRAEKMLEAKVFGTQGAEIGEIGNIILDQKNQVLSVIAEVGGMWDSGDRHVSVPWDEAVVSEDGVKVPVHQDNVEEFNIFREFDEAYVYKQELDRTKAVEEDVAVGPRTWKITDILHDYVKMKDGTDYGIITDAIFARDGVIQAIIVKPANTETVQGPRAYPFYGYPEAWRPGDTHYILPFAKEDIEKLPVFEYEKYKRAGNS
ncbi:PRC-barrel domain-containing protein [Halomonas sp. TRM85114]|uniref:PRC-barrel domain-containing protein n=1 Tax=Halomonas jincaotanensis TaxID=2810616 RepID=UPI001BD2964B|nr:PRC-barrel domain-containing protein [Halomonas jincaotanensis]MBS9405537.1 PRC-barrel domain-containing protein [Halomonas jincaotanensis]